MSSKQRRVVITGIGLVSPLGSTKEALWEALQQARSGVGPLSVVPPGAVPVDVFMKSAPASFMISQAIFFSSSVR